MQLEELGHYKATRQRWVLFFGLGQLVVLASGAAAGFATGFLGFLALAAAWMFLATRISRYVVGDRGLDQSVGRQVQKRVLTGGLHGEVPADVAEAAAAVDAHRRIMLPLPYAMSGFLLLGLLALLLPSAGPWLFGVAAVAGIGSLAYAWSQRKGWAEARARIDAWAEHAQPLEPAAPAGPNLQLLEGGRSDESETP